MHLIFSILLAMFSICPLDALSQTAVNTRLVSEEQELNFAFTDKRGIKADNGIVYFIEAGLRTITAYDNGKVKWKVDVLAGCESPYVGAAKIRHIKLVADKIYITFGKHDFATADRVDGKVNYLGAD